MPLRAGPCPPSPLSASPPSSLHRHGNAFFSLVLLCGVTLHRTSALHLPQNAGNLWQEHERTRPADDKLLINKSVIGSRWRFFNVRCLIGATHMYAHNKRCVYTAARPKLIYFLCDVRLWSQVTSNRRSHTTRILLYHLASNASTFVAAPPGRLPAKHNNMRTQTYGMSCAMPHLIAF